MWLYPPEPQAAEQEAARHEARYGQLASITQTLRRAARLFGMPEYWRASSLQDAPRRHVSRHMVEPLQAMLRATAKRDTSGALLDRHAREMHQATVRCGSILAVVASWRGCAHARPSSACSPLHDASLPIVRGQPTVVCRRNPCCGLRTCNPSARRQVTCVERIENPAQWAAYCGTREKIRSRHT